MFSTTIGLQSALGALGGEAFSEVVLAGELSLVFFSDFLSSLLVLSDSGLSLLVAFP